LGPLLLGGYDKKEMKPNFDKDINVKNICNSFYDILEKIDMTKKETKPNF
jgi:hypothetical protein